MKIVKVSICFLLFILNTQILFGQHIKPWGDQGNGTYINPILNADYSDPDVIRVGEKYYMICSEFHYMGMTIQESNDLINWRIIGRVYERLNFKEYDELKRYAGGSWAPSLRYHDGKFWIYFCTPNEGLFMTNATKPEGPWLPLVHVKNISNWEDPCPFWDDDGNTYLGHSVVGAGPIILHKMSRDGKTLLDEGATVYKGPVAEGTKIHKFNGFYYFSIPEGGVRTGWQTILRSKSIYGPYERKVVLEKGSTSINGPHQGAIVDTPNGEWWFYHFQYAGALGRVLHLQPMQWVNNWPVIGVDLDGNGVGEPVYTHKKPRIEKKYPVELPATNDQFDSKQLGLQWQWNHNPVDQNWSLSERPGYLRLRALKAVGIKDSKNTLTQKIMGNGGDAICKLDLSKLSDGQRAGLVCLSKISYSIGVEHKDNKLDVFFEGKDGVVRKPIKGKSIYFKLSWDMINQKNSLSYSLDNKRYDLIGDFFTMEWGYWKGAKIGIYNYNVIKDGGIADFDFLHYHHN